MLPLKTIKKVTKMAIKGHVGIIIFFLPGLVCFNIGGNISQNPYGMVIPEKTKVCDEVTVEQVKLYSQAGYNSAEKIVRKGVLYRCNSAKATILICHGFMCDKYDVGILRKVFKKSQFNVMVFDFRAHGEDREGQYCTFGRDEAFEVIAAARFLRNYPPLKGVPLIAYGFSMGAVSAIAGQALALDLFDGMIVDCPFDSSEKVIEKGLEGLRCSIFGYQFSMPGREFLQRHAFHPYVQALVKSVLKTVAQMDATGVKTNFCPLYPAELAKKINIPVFFIHCKNDQKVSVEQVMNVYVNTAGYKRLWLTNGRRHYDSFIYNPEKYIELVRSFCYQVINGDILEMAPEGILEDEPDDDSLFE
jgi:pimeloyl-ACP methyl ester carboxylesterase